MTKRNKQAVVEDRWEKKATKGRQTKPEEKSEVKAPVQAKNTSQKEFLNLLKHKQVIVYNAPAGVGKSFVTMSEVTDWLKKGIYDRLTITRPSIGMGNTLGLLPGSLTEKYEPYLLPLIDVICNRYGKGFYESSTHNGTIELQALEYVRGRNFNNIVVLDESQNLKPEEMYTILTRIGEWGKLIILGDPTQTDIRGKNGLQWLDEFLLSNPELKEHVGIVKATSDEIVRSGLCKAVVKAKERTLK